MLRFCSECAHYVDPSDKTGPLARCRKFRSRIGPNIEPAPCRILRDATGECGIEGRYFEPTPTITPKPLPWWRRLFSRRTTT